MWVERSGTNVESVSLGAAGVNVESIFCSAAASRAAAGWVDGVAGVGFDAADSAGPNADFNVDRISSNVLEVDLAKDGEF
jgi:hypothetical protein